MKNFLLAFFCFSTLLLSKELTVSIPPQEFFVKKIVGDKFSVNVMVKAGAYPATYEPKISQMRKLAKSEIYFSIGVPFEKVWLEKFENANKNMLIVDTSRGIEKLKMEEQTHNEEAEHHNEHKHTGLDPHIWLDPILVKVQIKNILDAVVKIDKQNSSFYKANYEKFLGELEVLNKKIKTILEPYKNSAFMVFHPSWGYFSKRYHLEQISIEVQGKEPKPAQLVELVKEIKAHNIKTIFVAPQFSQKGAKTISNSVKVNVATIDPLDIKWDENLIKVAKKIANIF